MIRKKGDLLFFKNGELRAFLEEVKAKLKKEIETYEPNYILNVSEHDLQEYLISKYSIESPKLIKEKLYVDGPYEVDIDVSHPNRLIIDRNRPVYIKGTKVVVVVPFSGDGRLFYYKPSTSSLNPPRGEIKESGVHLIYELTEHNSEMLKKEYQKDLDKIEKYLEWISRDIDQFNKDLENYIKQLISQRKNKLLKDMNLVASLEIPIKRSENFSATYSTPPIAPKKPKINPPQASTEPFKLEPTLSLQEYENILEILFNMSIAMERSPKVFSRLKEEEIRDFFLVMLNAHYEGQATGETFNFTGKTDILIRYEGSNVFIAECKFWRGEKKLINTLNQLLGYCSWRDTKTAILLFNKNQSFSSVLEKIDPTIKKHPCYKRDFNKLSKLNIESVFSYVLHLPQDKNREVILTVMAFDIPKNAGSS